jgi:hypothetical protein
MPGKEMGSRGPRRSAQDWFGLIEEWRGSGIDLTEFCRERRIAPSSLRWWRWRLGLPSDRAPIRSVGVSRTPSRAANEWIQLEIESPRSSDGVFELRWPSGRVLAIPANFDSEALGRLLAVVERSAC